MFDILFDPSQDKSKRETSANNMIALSRESAGNYLELSQSK